MPFIRSGMYRDALGTKALTIQCQFHHIRIIGPTGISQGGDFVNIHTQFDHFSKLKGIFVQIYTYNTKNRKMSLKASVESEIKNAMLAKDKDRLRALRAIKSLILLEETKGGSSGAITEEDELKLLTKAAKQRKDSADIYKQQNREDLWAVEMSELEIINEFLPKQLSEEELEEELKKIIEEVGAEGPKDMGKVMGAATKALAGKADGKMISQKVKSLLS